jgi:hypothetical protein
MVKGLEIFREWFADFADCYALIGGAACDLWMGERGLEFRATKDLDIVLVFDGQRPDFIRRFWQFVKRGDYAGFRAGESPRNFYRFQKPKRQGFPYKLEICTKRPLHIPAEVSVIRIPAGEDISSLSAILLDAAYFDLVRTNCRVIQGVPAVSAVCLIPLKAKAWLNLSGHKAAGAIIDQLDIDKHRNDVFRLLMTLAPADKIQLVPAIRADLRRFIEQLSPESPAWERIAGSLKSASRLILPPPAETIRFFREFHDLD